jgi:1,4-dihydroxy-2-naphthoate octaprenyltransferase
VTGPQEPTPASLRNPLARYALATRPPFLVVTFVGVLIGFATAAAAGAPVPPALAAAALLLGLVVHAAVNVLNDYYDALNGSDAANTGRVFPFTGGSRFIQNGVLSAPQTARYGWLLLAVAAGGGLALTAHAGAGLIAIGLPGVLIGWAYSAPPLALNSRGLGEVSVAAGFALVVVGADFVLRHAFSALPLAAAVPYALLVTNILYINQFPDREADAQAGKRHWVVRLGAQRAVCGYHLLAAFAYGWLLLAVVFDALPAAALLALAALPLTVMAARDLRRHAAQPALLAPAIRLTIAAAVMHGAVLAAAIFVRGQT